MGTRMIASGSVLPVQDLRIPAADAAGLVCSHPAMVEVFALAARVATWNLSVLITGETGVGKDVVAAAIHRQSRRAGQPMLAINCAALSPNLLESQLFGHEKGAFTGATTAQLGLLEAAAGGTVFLDEVGELTPNAQCKLLRALECRQVTPVGGTTPRAIDVRFLAATNRDLEQEISRGRFRLDLYHRLSGMTITIPPLRQRRSEIPELARAFLAQLHAVGPPRTFSPSALERMTRHDWPGNARELKATVERALLMCDGPTIGPEHLHLTSQPAAWPPLPESGRVVDRDRIVEALTACAGNQTRAAALLGIGRRTLLHKLDALGLPRPRKA